MYAALWRVLPGPVWLRILILVVLVAAILYVLAFYVFPWIDELTTPTQDVTVDQ
ncbi:hypothetical protein GCM10010988_24640 [Cnuibacter physcomitrellae]|uniref:DUF4175 domain-containing protein n=1 Tax=Cnuibacter physcomitrellae TaxID=1619308 RepID=UPI0013B37D60|nr:DUF4175 domain-containing protein [Cnuibacter physcomitrellae]MCS5497501.1 hypothetical protein [Cnuibacter physcomitrellae]GGI39552.1 hypothetical protein GCM10010988_24640 [Cnuibacter physcomitrellae]